MLWRRSIGLGGKSATWERQKHGFRAEGQSHSSLLIHQSSATTWRKSCSAISDFVRGCIYSLVFVFEDMENAGMHKRGDWFFQDEFKWRRMGSVFWTLLTTFPILAVFLIGLTISLSRHVYFIFDYLSALTSLYVLGIFIMISMLNSLFVLIHSHYYAASQKYPKNRLELVRNTFNTSSITYVLSSALSSILLSYFVSCILSGKYSHSYYDCESQKIDSGHQLRECKSGFLPVFLIHGFALGVVNGFDWILNGHHCSSFSNVQEAKFLYLKCKFTCLLSNCSRRSAKMLYYFAVVSYICGCVVRDVFILFSESHTNELYSFQFWRIFQLIPLAWYLWLVGMLFLLLWELSWEFFNAYQTQKYEFLLEAVFPEDQSKVLFENLEPSNSPLLQHLALKHLSNIAKKIPSKRQKIFSLSRDGGNGQPVYWNKVLNVCLHHIKKLTDDILEYQATYSVQGQSDKTRTCKTSPSSETGTLDTTGFAASGQTTILSTNHDTARYRGVHELASFRGDHNLSIGVPTPRLFSRPNVTASENDDTVYEFRPQLAPKSHLKDRIQAVIKQTTLFSFAQYFLKPVPAWTLKNIYRDHVIVKWSTQSLSYLCAMSVNEDKFGVVQGRLREVFDSLVELLQALENVGKLNLSSSYLKKLHTSIHIDVRTSIHRIVNAFGDSLNSVNLSPECKSLVQTFSRYDE